MCNYCAPGESIVAGARGTIGVDLEVLEAERHLDVIGCQRRQSTAQRVPCTHRTSECGWPVFESTVEKP